MINLKVTANIATNAATAAGIAIMAIADINVVRSVHVPKPVVII